MDTWWRRLQSAALVGTGRRPPPSLEEVELPRAAAPAPRTGARPEEAALDAAALGAALRRAGRVASASPVVVPEAPPERLPEAPPRARQLLELLLTQPPTEPTGTEELVLHWLATCHQAGYRVPHRLLPVLLESATGTEQRARVGQVAGERGAWLAAQNPDWAWMHENPHVQAASHGADELNVDPRRWALAPGALRVEQLRDVRRRDPAAGRDLLLTTWSKDSAKHRAALLETLLVNLGPDDEALLERALDDRAMAVRNRAAQLLDALPGSRRAARMAERLRPLVGEAGRLRRQLEVRLPDDPDAAGRRDGLGRPPAGRSSRSWWLELIVAGSPFDVWEGPADRVVARIKDKDVLSGLRTAATMRRDADWARALLDLGTDPELLAVLPPEERERRTVDELERAADTGVPALLAGLPAPWSPQLSAAAVARLARLKPEQTGRVLEAVLPGVVRGLHPDAVPALQRWRARTKLPPRYDLQIGSVIQTSTLRHTISEAFQT